MEIDEALSTHLMAQDGLTALISTRYYPDIAIQSAAMPYVIYQFISNVPQHTLSGQLKQERPMIQFTAYATTRAGARSVSAQLKLALSDYHGTLSGIVVQHIKLVNEIPSTIHNEDGTLSGHTVDLEYEVIFERG